MQDFAGRRFFGETLSADADCGANNCGSDSPHAPNPPTRSISRRGNRSQSWTP